MNFISKVAQIVCVALPAFVAGYLLCCELNPQPGIEFNSSLDEIISANDSPFWAAKVKGVEIFCDEIFADPSSKYRVIMGDITRNRVFHVSVPSLHSFPEDTEMVSKCFIRDEGE